MTDKYDATQFSKYHGDMNSNDIVENTSNYLLQLKLNDEDVNDILIRMARCADSIRSWKPIFDILEDSYSEKFADDNFKDEIIDLETFYKFLIKSHY